MKNKIYELTDDTQVLVLQDKEINNKKYVVVVKCNCEKDEADYKNIMIKVVDLVDDSVVLRDPKTKDEFEALPKLFEV